MFPPMPGAGAPASTPPPAPPQGGTGLVDQSQGPQASPSQGPTPEDLAQQFMIQIRDIHMKIDALAGEYPAASKDLRAAKQALTDSMTSVAGSLTQTNGAAQPRTF